MNALQRHLRSESGVVLVHVLILAVLLTILATGLMKIVFSNHVIVAKVKNSNEKRYWIEACASKMYAQWGGGACSNGTCNFTGENPPGPMIQVVCTGNQVDYSVTW